jgi:hypothetical protein
MRHRNIWIVIALNILIAIVPIAAPTLARAQWLNQPTPGIPRTSDGKPNLSARTPRTADGKPDLSGLWQTESAPPEVLARLLPGGGNGSGEDAPSQYFLNILYDFKPEEAPLQPAAAAQFRQLAQSFTKESPLSHCLPTGLPMVEIAPNPYKIIQGPGMLAMLYERDTTFRQIYTDGRKLPADPSPSWMGYSAGKWDGDALVVDTVGLNERSWLDARGHTHSEALRLTERFHRLDFGHMEVQMTFDDPKTYTKPFTIKLKQRFLPDTDLLESFCSENERDLVHIQGK